MSLFFRKRSSSTSSKASKASNRQSLQSVATVTTLPPNDGPAPQPEVLGGKEQDKKGRRGTGYSVSLGNSLSGLGGSTNSMDGRGRERGSSQSESLVISGYLMKKGVINQSYKKRWFVLTTKSLSYFESTPTDGSDAPKGMIPLSIVTKVEIKDENSKERFDICTPSRVYRIRASTPVESEKWVSSITGAVSMEHKNNPARSRRPSLSIVDSLRQEGDFNPDARVYAPADVSRYEAWNSFEVAAWMGTFGLYRSGQKFFAAEVTGSKLSSISTKELDEMGITEKKDQILILARISSLLKGEIGN